MRKIFHEFLANLMRGSKGGLGDPLSLSVLILHCNIPENRPRTPPPPWKTKYPSDPSPQKKNFWIRARIYACISF